MKVRVLAGDCRELLRKLPAESVHCVVTSPPYWGLRAYGGDPGMIGLEPTFEEHLENLVAVFREVRRVLRKDGTLWLNYGDAYANDGKWGGSTGGKHAAGLHGRTGIGRAKVKTGLKPKDLMMMPARVAMALQADGWWLRSEIVWHKPNPMPESVTDRPTNAHEKLFLLSRSARYFYDAEAVRVSVTGGAGIRRPAVPFGKPTKGEDPQGSNAKWADGNLDPSRGANLRNVWKIATHSFKEAHFATFPPKLVEPCIKAGTSERGACPGCGAPWARVTETSYTKNRPSAGSDPRSRSEDRQAQGSMGGHRGYRGNNLAKHTETTDWTPTCDHDADPAPCTVLDPFAGAGTVGLVADRLNRNAVLIEISAEYAEMAERRIRDDAPLFANVGAL